MEFNFENEEDLLDLNMLNSPGFADMFSKNDIIIFLVDAQSFIFMNPNIEENNLTIVTNAYLSMLKSKIISNPNNRFGLVLYNTQKQKNHFGLEHIWVAQIPDALTPGQIKEAEEFKNSLLGEIGVWNGEVSLRDALWVCHSLLKLAKVNARAFDQRVFLFTVNDSPNSDSPAARAQTQEYASVILSANGY